jgi:hypothetical protein
MLVVQGILLDRNLWPDEVKTVVTEVVKRIIATVQDTYLLLASTEMMRRPSPE